MLVNYNLNNANVSSKEKKYTVGQNKVQYNFQQTDYETIDYSDYNPLRENTKDAVTQQKVNTKIKNRKKFKEKIDNEVPQLIEFYKNCDLEDGDKEYILNILNSMDVLLNAEDYYDINVILEQLTLIMNQYKANEILNNTNQTADLIDMMCVMMNSYYYGISYETQEATVNKINDYYNIIEKGDIESAKTFYQDTLEFYNNTVKPEVQQAMKMNTKDYTYKGNFYTSLIDDVSDKMYNLGEKTGFNRVYMDSKAEKIVTGGISSLYNISTEINKQSLTMLEGTIDSLASAAKHDDAKQFISYDFTSSILNTFNPDGMYSQMADSNVEDIKVKTRWGDLQLLTSNSPVVSLIGGAYRCAAGIAIGKALGGNQMISLGKVKIAASAFITSTLFGLQAYGTTVQNEYNKNKVKLSLNDSKLELNVDYSTYSKIKDLDNGEKTKLTEFKTNDENGNSIVVTLTIEKTGDGEYSVYDQYGNIYDLESLSERSNKGAEFKALLYGAFEVAQWWTAAKINNVGKVALDGKLVDTQNVVIKNVLRRVGLDIIDSAIEVPIRTGVDFITDKDLTLTEAWKGQGGWSSLVKQSILGGFLSITSEYLTNQEFRNALSDTVSQFMGDNSGFFGFKGYKELEIKNTDDYISRLHKVKELEDSINDLDKQRKFMNPQSAEYAKLNNQIQALEVEIYKNLDAINAIPKDKLRIKDLNSVEPKYLFELGLNQKIIVDSLNKTYTVKELFDMYCEKNSIDTIRKYLEGGNIESFYSFTKDGKQYAYYPSTKKVYLQIEGGNADQIFNNTKGELQRIAYLQGIVYMEPQLKYLMENGMYDFDTCYRLMEPHLDAETKKYINDIIAHDYSVHNPYNEYFYLYTYRDGPYLTAYKRGTTYTFKGDSVPLNELQRTWNSELKSYLDTGKITPEFYNRYVNNFYGYLSDTDTILRQTMQPITEPMSVYRKAGSVYFNGMQVQPAAGVRFNDDGFVSTSVYYKEDLTFGDIDIKILLPEGVEAIYMDSAGHALAKYDFNTNKTTGQKELLLNGGYTYEFTGDVEIAPDGKKIYVAKVVETPTIYDFSSSKQNLYLENMRQNGYYSARGRQYDISSVNEKLYESGAFNKINLMVDDINVMYKNATVLEHGAEHVKNVVTCSAAIGQDIGLNQRQMDMLLNAAKYHDIGLNGNNGGAGHGMAAARTAYNDLESVFTEQERRVVAAAIEYHAIDDSPSAFNTIANKYGLTGQSLSDFDTINKVLKDADALDRTRFLGNLDESKLRYDSSKHLVEYAASLNEERATSILNRQTSPDVVARINSNRAKGISDYIIYMGLEYGDLNKKAFNPGLWGGLYGR